MKRKVAYEAFPYKTSCELCVEKKGIKKSPETKTMFSFMDQKGQYRAACKKHLKKLK